ncbi:MAG: aspartate aminotransferase family protein [Rhodospirillaceae bacterium]|nr:aspartate aminotransferase family protein [Rhodospirillaceae bacterium]|tara:strand:- start:1070 stop:2473 length:1404 start_codon:yes stop_codon:yes gene_type:complete
MKENMLPYNKPNINWSEIESWDRKYYLHNTQAQNEYVFFPIEAVDKNYLYLPDGKRLLDFQSQLVSDNMGHRNQRVHDEIKMAMERYGHIFFGLCSDYRAKAAKLLINDIIGNENWAGRVRILSSGTEAVENAMSMARLYRGASTILTQELSYHGLVPGATQLDGYRGNLTKDTFSNESHDVPGFPDKRYVNIPAPEYSDYINKGILPSLKETEKIIKHIGSSNIAGIITETMFGGASYMPHTDYLKGIYDLCKKHNILWILDDVLCGFGRLGEWFSYQIEKNIYPDLLITGKGLNGCALPVGAIITSREIGEFFDKARWWSGSTHDAHPLVCASIVGNIESMIENDIIKTTRTKGKYLHNKLLELKYKHPCIGRISGRGMYYSVDMVDLNGEPIIKDDRKTRFTGNLSNNPNNIFANFCIENGLFAGGFMPNTIKAAPPLTISIDEIDFAIDIMNKAFTYIEEKFH